MDTVLSGLNSAQAYLDDILIKSETQNQHGEDVKKVFDRIQDYGFKISEEKCELFMFRVKYLGQIINANGR